MPYQHSGIPEIESFLQFVETKKIGCWLFRGAANRYGHFRKNRAHRYAYEFAFGPVPDGLHVLHRCDNPLCVRPSHLFLGTHEDNMRDMAEKGRAKSSPLIGSSHPSSKLKECEVEEILRLVNQGVIQRKVSKMFRVSPMLVTRIVHRKSWKHVQSDWASV